MAGKNTLNESVNNFVFHLFDTYLNCISGSNNIVYYVNLLKKYNLRDSLPDTWLSSIEKDDEKEMNAFIIYSFREYFRKTKDKQFLKDVISETCDKNIFEASEKCEGKIKSVTTKKGKSKQSNNTLSAYVSILMKWANGASDHEIESCFRNKEDLYSFETESFEEFAGKVSYIVQRKLSRKAGKPIDQAVYEHYVKSLKEQKDEMRFLPDIKTGKAKMMETAKLCVKSLCDVKSVQEIEKIIPQAFAMPKMDDRIALAANNIIIDLDDFLRETNWAITFTVSMEKTSEIAKLLVDERARTEKNKKLVSESAQAIQKAEDEKNAYANEAKKIKEENERLCKRIADLEKKLNACNENSKKDKDINKLHTKIREIKKTAKKLKKENTLLADRNEALEEEVNELRNSIRNVNVSIRNVDMDGKYLFITDKDIMKTKIHEWFPNSIVSDGTNIKKINNVKLAVIICPEVSHSEYYRAKEACKNIGISFIHCSHISLDSICQCISEKENGGTIKYGN